VHTNTESNNKYNLFGQKVNDNYKGIIIEKGKIIINNNPK